MTVTTDTPPEIQRIDLTAARRARREAASKIRRLSRAARKAQAAYDAAVEARDAALIASHGDRRDGGLSYEDLAEATGTTEDERISKGRVIQIVQGKSDYSKRQARAARPEA